MIEILIFKVMRFVEKVKEKTYSLVVSASLKSFGKNSKIMPLSELRGGGCISVGSNSRIGRGGFLTAWESVNGIKYSPSIIIGNNVSVGDYFHITAINKITIADGVLTGKFVTITDNSHGKSIFEEVDIRPGKRIAYSKASVHIGQNVWIGDKVTILPGVSIGEGAVIGANTVVTKDIPSNTVVAGNPAKIIKIIE